METNQHHTDFTGTPLRLGDTVAASVRDLAALTTYEVVGFTVEAIRCVQLKPAPGTRYLSNLGRKDRLMKSNQLIKLASQPVGDPA